jgi:predicted restriction endonuclease
VQRGPAALSIQTSSRAPYADAETEEPEPVLVADFAERRYVVRETKVRLHQARFRGAVLPAYRDQCTICRLKEVRLLDAAHIKRGRLTERLALRFEGFE